MGRQERMKLGSGMNGRVDRLGNGDPHCRETLVKIKPTDPFRLVKEICIVDFCFGFS